MWCFVSIDYWCGPVDVLFVAELVCSFIVLQSGVLITEPFHHQMLAAILSYYVGILCIYGVT